MCKRYTKISKILTNIHAGFATALLGCVLTFAPLSAMAEITFTPGTCTKLGDTYTGSYTNLSANAQVCRNGEVIYFRTSSGTVYSHSSCLCGTNETPVYASANIRQYCGTNAELTYVTKCNTSGSGGTTSCTPTTLSQLGGVTYTPVNNAQNCLVTKYQRVAGNVYASCESCSGSMPMKTEYAEVPGCDDYEFSTCPCTLATQCTGVSLSDTNLASGVRSAYTRTCNTLGLCGRSLSSCACMQNYYGTVSKSGQTCSGTCTKCATDPKTGVAGVTASYGNGTASERCYIPSGNSFTDEKGSGTYSGACYDL